MAKITISYDTDKEKQEILEVISKRLKIKKLVKNMIVKSIKRFMYLHIKIVAHLI
ncbi:hypothetical protein H477_4585 [[Clostridium] sordellii ATCC 9714]|nr:hypothetical protein H477_4585 [[Clostridium] sordellii ATCC 9714] [Paeniclostridium sordellii ATCC 9714]